MVAFLIEIFKNKKILQKSYNDLQKSTKYFYGVNT